MEENVALDSKKQRKFVKSIRGIKKLIKKNEGKAVPEKKEETVKPKKPFSMKLKKDGKINKKWKRKERGLVYLSHIPHGFYEHQMTEYFKQFGVVTNVRVIRSKRTGNSKGFAFVEFKEPSVGQIVAETMNNYLMGKRLIKAAYIPPEKQKLKALRKNWNQVNNPASQQRLKTKKAFNADKDEAGELKRARKLLSNLNKNKKKLSEIGINYDFFAPVDVPEELLSDIVKQEKEDKKLVKEETKPKKNISNESNKIKIVEDDSEFEESSDDDEVESDDDEEESSSDEEPSSTPPKKLKGNSAVIKKAVKPVQTKKQIQKKQPQKPQAKKQEQKKPVEAIKKAPQKPAVSPKKAKFVKQNQKPMKKQFKKK